MKAVVFLGERKLELMDVPDPSPAPDEVVIEIKASGMCGSDLHQYRGPKKEKLNIAGHEPCGIIAEVGSGVPVALAKVGDRVMDHHYSGCGVCKHCCGGWSQMCLEGSIVYGGSGDGAHARYMLASSCSDSKEKKSKKMDSSPSDYQLK